MDRQTNRTELTALPLVSEYGVITVIQPGSRVRVIIIFDRFQIGILCPLPPLLPTPPSLRSTTSPSQRSTGSCLMEDNAQDSQQISHTNQIDEIFFFFKSYKSLLTYQYIKYSFVVK